MCGPKTMYVYNPDTGLYESVVKGEESLLHVLLGDAEEEVGDYAMQCG